MTAVLAVDVASLRAAVTAALDTVLDPELDEPITDLGFVRSVEVDVHGARSTSTCGCRRRSARPTSPGSWPGDAREAVSAVPGVTAVTVELDDHHDSDLINAGLARGDDYRGTFGHEAEDSLDDLRLIFRRKAHVAAMERALTAWLHEDAGPDRDGGRRASRSPTCPPGASATRCCSRRAALGCHAGADRRRARRGRRHAGARRGRRQAVADGAVGAHQHRRQRALLPRPAADPLPRLGGRPGARASTVTARNAAPCPCSPLRRDPVMKAVRILGYHNDVAQDMRLDDVPQPEITGPHDVIVKIGGGGCLPHRHPRHRGAVGREDATSRCRTRSATRTRAGCTRSAAPSPTSPSATR